MNTTAKANRQYFLIKKYPNIAKQRQNDVSMTSESSQAIKGGQKWLKGSSYPSTERARCKQNLPGKLNSLADPHKHCNSSCPQLSCFSSKQHRYGAVLWHCTPRGRTGEKGATLKGMCWETFQAQREQIPLARGRLRLQGSLGTACLHHLLFPSSFWKISGGIWS